MSLAYFKVRIFLYSGKYLANNGNTISQYIRQDLYLMVDLSLTTHHKCSYIKNF